MGSRVAFLISSTSILILSLPMASAPKPYIPGWSSFPSTFEPKSSTPSGGIAFTSAMILQLLYFLISSLDKSCIPPAPAARIMSAPFMA